MVAALLDLQIGARPAGKMADGGQGGRRRRLDVADGNPRRGFRHALPGRGIELLAAAEHMVGLRHGGAGGGIDLGGAAGESDEGRRGRVCERTCQWRWLWSLCK